MSTVVLPCAWMASLISGQVIISNSTREPAGLDWAKPAAENTSAHMANVRRCMNPSADLEIRGNDRLLRFKHCPLVLCQSVFSRVGYRAADFYFFVRERRLTDLPLR